MTLDDDTALSVYYTAVTGRPTRRETPGNVYDRGRGADPCVPIEYRGVYKIEKKKSKTRKGHMYMSTRTEPIICALSLSTYYIRKSRSLDFF